MSALAEMLGEKGFRTPHDKGVELWRMFHRAHAIMCEISDEIDRQQELAGGRTRGEGRVRRGRTRRALSTEDKT